MKLPLVLPMKKLSFVAVVLSASLAFAGDVQAQARPGSIFDPDRDLTSPIANHTARRPGDVLTVIVSENQGVSNQETSNLLKESSLDAQLSDLSIFPNAFNPLPSLDGESTSEFRGQGNYLKQGQFSARVTVIVVDTHPNGNLVVSGRREIRIDGETKLIEFSGIVRRYDITPLNTVESELVADARVSYQGMGPLTNATNRRGLGSWIHDAVDWVWPF